MNKLKKMSLQRKKRNRSNLKEVNKSDRPRLSVHRTNTHISAQIIDDIKGITICAYSTQCKDFKLKKTSTVEAATAVGTEIAKLALSKNVKDVVFDRGAYYYHGRVKALAEGAREAGLNF